MNVSQVEEFRALSDEAGLLARWYRELAVEYAVTCAIAVAGLVLLLLTHIGWAVALDVLVAVLLWVLGKEKRRAVRAKASWDVRYDEAVRRLDGRAY